MAVTALPFSYSPKDGDLIRCCWCRARYVIHLCSHGQSQSNVQSTLRAELLEVLVTEVTKACPTCGVWYKVGEIVERFNPELGRKIKDFALTAGIALLIIKGIQYMSGSD